MEYNVNNYHVYIMASKKDGIPFIGVSNKLLRRVIEHKTGLIKSFTKKYFVKKLVYYEGKDDIRIAIQREKQLKKWKRKWKIALIEKNNPEWKDLFYNIAGTKKMLEDNFPIG